MQISVLKKLLRLIRSDERSESEKPSEAISESREPESDANGSQSHSQSEDMTGEEIINALIGDEEPLPDADTEILAQTEEKSGFTAEIKEEGEPDSASERVANTENNRSHLTSSVPRAARAPMGAMTKQELREIRSLFSNLDDSEIQRLYKKVTKQN